MDETHPFFARKLSRGQLILLDLVAGLVVAFVFFTSAASASGLPPWVRVALPLMLGLSLTLRRVWPLSVFVFTLVLSIVATVLGAIAFAYFAPAYALYIVALTDKVGRMLPASAIGVMSLVTVAGLAVFGVPRQRAPEWVLHLDEPLMAIALLGGAWTIGRAVHERRLYAAREAERMAAQAVTDERLRIARELHDVVTHSVGLIAVKAGVANHVMASRPEEAHDALRVIETASRSALVEMRHLLGVLRSPGVPDLVPAPGLDGLEGLVQQARMAGVEVQFELRVADQEETDGPGRDGVGPVGAGGERPGGASGERPSGAGGERPSGAGGEHPGRDGGERGKGGVGVSARGSVSIGSMRGRDSPVSGEGQASAVSSGEEVSLGGRQRRSGEASEVRRMPDGVELAVYRIVQEALTNVAKHAAPARCRVSVVADGRDVRIEVVDDGPGRRMLPVEGAGHGLIGMRERVALYGGALEAGGLPGRGFRVFARLPYGERA